ncbi:MAG: T9SS type A sorting domain-containing protein [Bacteroidetes bacterium]|nr:T9SS type A sorting domain-containing protein [Bacteroidota bacterium]
MKINKILLTLLISLFSLSSLLAIPLAGNYTIDKNSPASATNFSSFNACANSLSTNGISADVIITVVAGSGPYTEQVVFSNIAGTSPTAGILLDGSGETIIGLTNTSARHTIRLSNMQYFDITNLKVERDITSTSGFYGIHLFGTCNNITISNCEVNMPGTNSTLVGAYIASGSETSILESGDFHDINILNNIANGGGYGASVFGLITDLASNIVISGNNFTDFHSNGVYLRETDGAIISNNNFNKASANVTSCNAIQIAQAANINAQIFNNFIKVDQIANGTMTFRGIYLFNGTGHKVYNNVIHDIKLTSGNVTGIEVRTAGTAPEIYFNTISIDNATASTGNLYGIKEELSNTNSILKNNLISISQTTTGIKSGLVLGATAITTSAFNSDYNDIWVPGGNTAMKGSLTPVLYNTLATWQSVSTQDANSISTDPVFLSVAVPQPTNVIMNDAGTTISSITTDVVGITRSIPPDIGAYEFLTSALNEINPSTNFTISTNEGNGVFTIESKNTNTTITGFETFDNTGKLIQSQKTSATTVGVDLSMLANGIYFLRINSDIGLQTFKVVK